MNKMMKKLRKFALLSLVTALFTGCAATTNPKVEDEFETGMENIPNQLVISQSGEYTDDSNYDEIIISAPDVTLIGATAENVTITAEVGDGDVTLDNVTVTKTLYVYGGGENSVHLTRSKINRVEANREASVVRICVEDATVLSGGFFADNAIVVVEAGVTLVHLTLGANTSLVVEEGARVEFLAVTDMGTNAELHIDGTVGETSIESTVAITGEGKIEVMNAAADALVENSTITPDTVIGHADAVPETTPEPTSEPTTAKTEKKPPHRPKPHVHVYELVDFRAPEIGVDGYEVYRCECGEGWTNALAALKPAPTPVPTPTPEPEPTPEPTPEPEPEVHEHSFVAVESVPVRVGRDGYTVYKCDCGEGYTQNHVAEKLSVSYDETENGLVFTTNAAEFVEEIYEVILIQSDAEGTVDKFDVAAAGLVVSGEKFTIPTDIVNEIPNGTYEVKITSYITHEMDISITTGQKERAEITVNQAVNGDLVFTTTKNVVDALVSVEISGNMVYREFHSEIFNKSETTFELPYEVILEAQMMANTNYRIVITLDGYDTVSMSTMLDQGYEKHIFVENIEIVDGDIVITFANSESLNEAQTIFLSNGNTSSSSAAYMMGEKDSDSLTLTIYGDELYSEFTTGTLTVGIGFYGASTPAWTGTVTWDAEDDEQIPGGAIPDTEPDTGDNEDDEIIDDEVIDDEIIDDDVVEDEIIDDEVIEDEIIDDEVIDEEIIEEDVVEDEIIEDEFIEEDVIEDEIVEDEVIDDEVIDEEVVEDEIVEEEVIDEDVVEEFILEEDEFVDEDVNDESETEVIIEDDAVEPEEVETEVVEDVEE